MPRPSEQSGLDERSDGTGLVGPAKVSDDALEFTTAAQDGCYVEDLIRGETAIEAVIHLDGEEPDGE